MFTQEEVLAANLTLHTLLADKYKNTEPHYRAENIARVRQNIQQIQTQSQGKSLLDIGCGMGFIIDIAKEFFEVIRGIDITPAMLEKVDTFSSKCDIEVQLGNSENIPFETNSFDVCTSYAVLHHLHALEPTFKEVYRVLKPGGIFYSDLDPNQYFWKSISELTQDKVYSDVVDREVKAILYKDQELESQFNIKKEVLKTAEHLKHIQGGFKEEQLLSILHEIGFSSVKVNYVWFLGEGKIIHDEKTQNSTDVLREYLHNILPLSRHLFKYISIIAQK